jgi:UDP-glucose 4-epimerase
MAKVLITGAGGYIGAITTDQFLKKGAEVVAVDNFSNGFRKPLEMLQEKYGKEKLAIHEADLTVDGAAAVLDQYEIDVVVHFAALLDVGESMEVPHKYFTNNVIGTQKLLHALIDRNINKFIFSSSCTVYGDIKTPPVNETAPVQPASSAYGATKQMCEQILKWYDKLDKMRYISLRYFNVCGAADDGTLGDAKKVTFGLMQNAIKGALGMQPFELNFQPVNTPDGSPIRDFINVVDLAEAHVAAYEFIKKENKSEIFNLGTGKGNSVLELVNEVKRILKADFPTNEAKQRRTGEIERIFADYTKAKNVLGWEPKRSLEQSITSLATFYKAHPNGY